jgi:hypothetical protein
VAEPGGPADSAGVPWTGRRFQPNPFAADDGSADPGLLGALMAFRSGASGPEAVVDAYRRARLLIPLVTAAGPGAARGLGEASQELSIVTVAAADGRRVLPVFTSVSSLAAWDDTARPVPADGVRTAVAAVGDDTDLIVIDPGAATEFLIRRPAVWAIARDEPWEPPARRVDVVTGFRDSIATELAVLDVRLLAGDPAARGRTPELTVELELTAGLGTEDLDAVLQRLARRWAADDRIATLVDSLSVRLVRS